ncbi:MAG: hypothetical protein ACM36C_13050 [Acidobacteriota bacterium]
MGALRFSRFGVRVAFGLVAALCVSPSVLRSQNQPVRTTQRFRTGIEIIRLEVTAIGGEGRAIPDLTAADFDVKIDGTPRQVRFARRTGVATGSGGAGAPTTVFPGSYATNSRSGSGRAVLFAVDLDSIRAGTERRILDTAARLVDALGPNDAVGLAPIPGKFVDLTREHGPVSDAVRTLHGTNIAPTGRHELTIEEAVAFERAGQPNDRGEIVGGDQTIIGRVIERECDAEESKRRPATQDNPLRLICPAEIQREARERLAYERMHVQALLSSLSSIAERLQHVDAPRTIVLISGGLIFESEGLTWFRQAERALKQANVTLYAVHVDQPFADASVSRSQDVQAYAARERETGLANVATMAGGVFFTGVGTPGGAFDRVKAEMSNGYELGVEALERDAQQPSLRVEVALKRPGVRLRYRPEVNFLPALNPTAKLANLITQPIDVLDLPIDAAAYTVRGDEPDTVRVLFVAELGRSLTVADPVQYAIAIKDAGKTAFETNGTATRTGDIARIQFATQLPPAAYRVRIAAVDGSGRGGSLDVPVSVGLRAAGEIHLSDLILGQTGATFAPAIQSPAGQLLGSYIELYSAEPARFADAAVRFELRRAGEAPVLAIANGTLRQTDSDRRQVAQGSISGADLPPGDYTVSAVVDVAGRPVGKVSRSIIVTEAPVASSETAAPAPAADPAPTVKLAKGSDSALEDVVRKMGVYVAGYGEKAGLLVAVEKYTQYEDPLPPRHITAEFALVKTASTVGWAGFRDVVEVDGEAVRDRRDRLLRLFTETSSPMAEAIRIANESARFNVGPVSRNFNVPTTTLFFFHPSNIGRFTFERKATKKIDGIETWEINFIETARPTMMGTRSGKDVPCQGTVWVRPSDGTVLRTRLRLRNFADTFSMGDSGAPSVTPNEFQPASGSGRSSSSGSGAGSSSSAGQSGSSASPAPATGGSSGGSGASGGSASGSTGGSTGSTGGTGAVTNGNPTPSFQGMDMIKVESRAEIEVSYQRDPQLDIWLPSKMSEEYEGAIPRIRRRPIVGTARSLATYSDFKQFETSAKIVPPK